MWNNTLNSDYPSLPHPKGTFKQDAICVRVYVCQVTCETQWPYFSVTFFMFSVCAVGDCRFSIKYLLNFNSDISFHRAK